MLSVFQRNLQKLCNISKGNFNSSSVLLSFSRILLQQQKHTSTPTQDFAIFSRQYNRIYHKLYLPNLENRCGQCAWGEIYTKRSWKVSWPFYLALISTHIKLSIGKEALWCCDGGVFPVRGFDADCIRHQTARAVYVWLTSIYTVIIIIPWLIFHKWQVLLEVL